MSNEEPSEMEQDSINLIYDEILWALETQVNSLRSVENKAATLMGFSGTIVALLFSNLQDNSLGYGIRILILSSISLSLIAILLSATVFWSKRMRSDPTPETLLHKFHNRSRRETQLQVAVNRVDAYIQNRIKIERAAQVFRLATLLQTVSILTLGLAIFMLIY